MRARVHACAQAYLNDLPRERVEFEAAAMRLVEGDKGRGALSASQKARILAGERVRAGRLLGWDANGARQPRHAGPGHANGAPALGKQAVTQPCCFAAAAAAQRTPGSSMTAKGGILDGIVPAGAEQRRRK